MPDAPLELPGSISVELCASTDSIDTNFTPKLVEVKKDGYARLIDNGIIRTRYSLSEKHPSRLLLSVIER